MIKIRDSVENPRARNLVQSVITAIINAPVHGYPNTNGCVRYLASFIDKRDLTPDAIVLSERIATHLGVKETPDHDGIVNLIVRIHHASSASPDVLESLECAL